jgi:hypothetical protein
MLQPSNDHANPAFLEAEPSIAADPVAAESTRTDSSASARVGDEQVSPVCAAYWAY